MANGKIVAKHLRLDRHCIYQSLQHHNFIDDDAIDFWSGTKRREWCTTLSIELKTLVVEWWTMETTISPNWKKVCKKRIGVKQLIEDPTHLLQVSQVSDKKTLS